ncbi:MAG TPA: GrpB family protein [Polyangiaceae bacterium]|jgi:GrpB-like predicted nucleotidyltransferase (UPF0157 family)|nr:GrpB family protein [Polyangiaceae bacterium]
MTDCADTDSRRTRRITIVAHDPRWASVFRNIAHELRRIFGAQASRIDHIGSTSVPELAAKPVIDIQASVPPWSSDPPWHLALVAAGWKWDAENDERTKRFYVAPPSGPLANLHVREAGSLTEQLALVFRDYLRTNRDAAGRYEAFKQKLAARMWRDGDEYADAKTEIVWPLLHEAYIWSMRSGWHPGPSDG